MTRLLKNNWLIIAAGVVAIFAGVALQTVKAFPSTIAFEATATNVSSVSYLAAGTSIATSTFNFNSTVASNGKLPNMQKVDRTSLFVQFISSSTASTLAIVPQVSNDNVNWYPINQAVGTQTALGNITLASSSNTYLWNPVTTATATMAFILPEVPTQYERVLFYIAPGTANGSVYSEVDLKSNPSNP